MAKTPEELAAEILVAMIAKGTNAEREERYTEKRAEQFRILYHAIVAAIEEKTAKEIENIVDDAMQS